VIQFKVIYWGPAEAGKTTSLLGVRYTLSKHVADDLFAVQTTMGRTLWNEYNAFYFDIPIAKGGFVKVIIHLTALTGQERFLATREHVGMGADGVIFVADCRREYLNATKRSFEELLAFIRRFTPLVIQANFQDIINAANPEELGRVLDLDSTTDCWLKNVEIIPTIAREGINVTEAFVSLLGRMLLPKH